MANPEYPTVDPPGASGTDLPRQFALAWPAWQWSDVTTLVAVSGGADSVALLRLLAAAGTGGRGRLVVAHYDHGWRGREARQDAAFVQHLAGQLEMVVETGRAAGHRQPMSEDAAREARYEFLAATAHRVGARYIVTAHTSDDQVETVLHRFLRGTGVAGLSGIPRVRPVSEALSLVRPLLGFHRADLRAYLAHVRQPFREDSTNQDSRRTRNRIRRDLLPLLRRDYNLDVDNAVLRLASLAGEIQDEIDGVATVLLESIQESSDDSAMVLRLDRLPDLSPFLRRQLLIAAWSKYQWPLQSMGFVQWKRLGDMMDDSTTRTAMFPGQIQARREGRRLTLRKQNSCR